MDFIVFGDDWGVHPNTAQHLAKALNKNHRIIWVNSIGMRSPKVNRADVMRLWRKGITILRAALRRPQTTAASNNPTSADTTLLVLHPAILPWHMTPVVTFVNRRILARQITTAMHRLGIPKPFVITSNPAAVPYFCFPHENIFYLRLDDYKHLPGVDIALVQRYEPQACRLARAIFVTARDLTPSEPSFRIKTSYLPQGVDVELFSLNPLAVPASKTIGFFGLLAEWLDWTLIIESARNNPDWNFEFIGRIQHCPPAVTGRIPNIKILPAVPYSKLPEVMSNWRIGWIPFVESELTSAVNPLKLREYLAAGLPVISTPMPSVTELGDLVNIVRTVTDVTDSLEDILATDSVEKRRNRRAAMQPHSWTARAQRVVDIIEQV